MSLDHHWQNFHREEAESCLSVVTLTWSCSMFDSPEGVYIPIDVHVICVFFTVLVLFKFVFSVLSNQCLCFVQLLLKQSFGHYTELHNYMCHKQKCK